MRLAVSSSPRLVEQVTNCDLAPHMIQPVVENRSNPRQARDICYFEMYPWLSHRR